MKKALLLVMAVVCVMAGVEPVFAIYDVFSNYDVVSRAEEAKIQAYNKKAEVLLKEIQAFADKIAAYNKPAFEAKLTKKEREYEEWGDEGTSLSFIMWNRVYMKDKTCVFASAGKNKKFTASYFATTDPAFVFGSNIRVGAGTKVLENYFGDTVKNIGVTQGKSITLYGPMTVGVDGHFPIFAIACENGIITQIRADLMGGTEEVDACSQKAVNFADSKMKQIGFKNFADMPVWYEWSNYVNSHYSN